VRAEFYPLLATEIGFQFNIAVNPKRSIAGSDSRNLIFAEMKPILYVIDRNRRFIIARWSDAVTVPPLIRIPFIISVACPTRQSVSDLPLDCEFTDKPGPRAKVVKL
jgi:hypothetical protein